MNKKLLLACLIVLFAISLTFFVRINQKNYAGNTLIDTQSQNNVEIENSQNASINQETSGKIKNEELIKHNSLNDCWIVFEGKVYDITSFLPKHPGTSGAILPYCGSDNEFEKAFINKHGRTKVSVLMKVGVFIGDFDVMGDLN